jgi:hypothetical protein
MPTRKSPQLSPSVLMKHLRTGSVQILHHILTTQMVLYLSIHIELSLRLSFYLRHKLRGYMVGTTVGFPIEIVEVLDPQSHR